MAVINNMPTDELAEILHKGMVAPVRAALKAKLMTNLEKDVDEAIDKVLGEIAGFVEQHYDHLSGQVQFNIRVEHKTRKDIGKAIPYKVEHIR